MLDVLILVPSFIAFILGYYIIITKQYLKYEASVAYCIFWIASIVQALGDLVNIIFDPATQVNEMIAGYASFLFIFITAAILLRKIFIQGGFLTNFWSSGDFSDKIALWIFSFFVLIFLMFEFLLDFSDDSLYQWLMATIAIALDIVVVWIAKKEIYEKINEQVIAPWLLWAFALIWLCVLEAFFNYDEGFWPPSVGWIMLIENALVVLYIAYCIVDARTENSKKASHIIWDAFYFL